MAQNPIVTITMDNGDVMKAELYPEIMAMINIDKMLEEKHFETKLVLQIHDELIFKVPVKEINEVAPLIKDLMEQVYPKLGVKLKVDGSYAKTWYDAK